MPLTAHQHPLLSPAARFLAGGGAEASEAFAELEGVATVQLGLGVVDWDSAQAPALAAARLALALQVSHLVALSPDAAVLEQDRVEELQKTYRADVPLVSPLAYQEAQNALALAGRSADQIQYRVLTSLR